MSYEMGHGRDAIDILLNGYVDGELTAREQTEVQRLIARDKGIAERLRQIEACRGLVSSLPVAEAPAGLGGRVMAAARDARAAKTQSEPSRGMEGHLHLFGRHFFSVAAMAVLVGILAWVVYEILIPAPEESMLGAVAVREETAGNTPTAETTSVAVAPERAAEAFEARIILTARDLPTADAFVNKTIETSGAIRYGSARDMGPGTTYMLGCSRAALDSLLDDLATVWGRFESATLVVKGEDGAAIALEGASASQVAEVMSERSTGARARAAKGFAALNGIARAMPGREVLPQLRINPGMAAIPKPVLTSSEKAATDTAAPIEVRLTIVVAGAD